MSDLVLLILDSIAPRRLKIIDKLSDFPWVTVRGASNWDEIYGLAETHMPIRIAVASEISDSVEFTVFSKLLPMLGGDLVLYGDCPKARLGCKVVPLGDSEISTQFLTALLAGISQRPDARVKNASQLAKRDCSRKNELLPNANQMILIGASTGGIQALETVLQEFPQDCPPTLVVQHIRPGFANGLVRRLNDALEPKIVAAEDGMPLHNGYIYFATDSSLHLGVTWQGVPRAKLIAGSAVSGHCPSINILFEQAALLPSRIALRAALLTGMGADGASGMAELKRAGAFTIAQDEESSVVWGMPRVAIELGGVCEILPLSRIGQSLLRPLNVARSI